MSPVTVGAVAYHPRVVTIWESFVDHFARHEIPTDYVLYSSYEALVDAVADRSVDVGWVTNTAFVALDRRVGGATRILGMRDVDADFATVIVSRRDGGVGGAGDLAARRLAIGSRDCGHATILPIHYLEHRESIPPDSYDIVRFESDLGKHGDTGTAELEVLEAVAAGEADAGAVGDVTLERFRLEASGTVAQLRVIWRSPTYYHCCFAALESLEEGVGDAWSRGLLAMSYEDPEVRTAMELEGVRTWLRGDRHGYGDLRDAMVRQGHLA